MCWSKEYYNGDDSVKSTHWLFCKSVSNSIRLEIEVFKAKLYNYKKFKMGVIPLYFEGLQVLLNNSIAIYCMSNIVNEMVKITDPVI